MQLKKRVVIILFLFVLLYLIGNLYYKSEKKKGYTEKIQYVENRSKEEKNWMKENQGKDGEIYMNYTGGLREPGDVNPYFACLAAQGLLANEPNQEDMDCVRNYLLWHRKQFLRAKGEIENHRLVNGQLEATGERDSVDSYTAVFLSLLCRYGSLGGDLSEVDPGNKAFELGLTSLEGLTHNGLTQVDSDTAVFYFMDNAEVLAAYRDMSELAASPQGEKWLGEKQDAWVTDLKQIQKQSEEAIRTHLWNEKEKRFEIGLGGDGEVLKFSGWDTLYPNAVAQIYLTAFDLSFSEIDQKSLYQQFMKQYGQEEVRLGEADTFNWCVIYYTAAEMSDIKGAENFLEQYAVKVEDSRKYPLYTTDAGWILRTCGSLKEYYEQRMESGILSDLFNRLGDN